ncbi:hypothetical protein EYF80_009389 [Liparis tanakae]|uniref:Uncharacterized protein n=1 Tax=Liparis tanakae TaxID=230148 RepID=A0A4Z2IR21_9TELE|nr:hypothetical protein EYF80_009389 [Liparis tanakae]
MQEPGEVRAGLQLAQQQETGGGPGMRFWDLKALEIWDEQEFLPVILMEVLSGLWELFGSSEPQGDNIRASRTTEGGNRNVRSGPDGCSVCVRDGDV